MARAIVEEDGRIRLPEHALEAAHLDPGQELEFLIVDGALTLFTSGAADWSDTRYGPKFLAGLDGALRSAHDGLGVFDETDATFLASLGPDRGVASANE